MSGISKKLMGTTAAGGEALAIEDVFSTYLYTGTSAARTITNDIDLAGEGGLVWLKWRSGVNLVGNQLFTTDLGAGNYLTSNNTSALNTGNTTQLNAFNSDGFSLGNSTEVNYSGDNYASWTFRKAPRFFDVVTYTGDGVAGRQIAHNLGQEVGCIVIKRTDSTGNWPIWHRGAGHNGNGFLNSTQDFVSIYVGYFNSTAPTDSVFTVGVNYDVNASGGTYVAYLFAHDPLGPSGDGSDGLIACGSYTGTGAAGLEVNLGWEPQWFLMKRTDTAGSDWFIFDVMRGFTTDGDRILRANTSDAESDTTAFVPTPTGVKLLGTFSSVNASGGTYIYIAIRRGPMRAPTSGTEVFNDTFQYGEDGKTAGYLGSPADLDIRIDRTGGGSLVRDRLRGDLYLRTQATDAEAGSQSATWDNMTGYFYYSAGTSADTNIIHYVFKRAPGFFDVVAYSGDGVAGRTVPHNLGVAPEMMIVKTRSNISNWAIYHSAIGPTKYLQLPGTQQANTSSQRWNDTSPAADVFTVGNDQDVNTSEWTYIAYLFATLPGVSKVGSYTGNGSSQTIDCGFTSGARFIIIKRTDSTGDWYVWDSARGIVAGNDPHLSLNSTAAEVTTDDSVDAESSGFIVNQDAGTNVNVNTASYIFLAIA